MRSGIAGTLLAALVLAAPFQARAADDPAALLKKVDDRYRRVSSLRAGFVQRERVAALGIVREYRGSVAFRRPGQMRWDYASGPLRTVVADGARLWMYYPDESAVHRLSFGPSELARSPVAVLFDRSATLEGVFTAVSASPVEGGLVRLELRGRKEDLPGSSVALLVRPADGSVAGTILGDAYGNITEIGLQDPVEGTRLDDALFTFAIPAGARVVDR
jgi:outer membrane lipoprotein-sorting protein